jgi:hypothetical protein
MLRRPKIEMLLLWMNNLSIVGGRMWSNESKKIQAFYRIVRKAYYQDKRRMHIFCKIILQGRNRCLKIDGWLDCLFRLFQ